MRVGTVVAALAIATPVAAQNAGTTTEVQALRAELARARAEISAQDARLRALEARVAPSASGTVAVRTQEITPGTNPPTVATAPVVNAAPVVTAQATPVERVGEAPAAADRPPEVAVLGQQGSIVTQRGQLTGEMQFDYARADRNRAFAAGNTLFQVLQIGLFDINQSRQDVLTASGSLRYGVSNKLEVGVRVPFVHRTDTEILAPVQGSTNNDPARTVDGSARANNIGDVEVNARYQLTSARGGWPFLIAGLQGVVPTGSDPFKIPRNDVGTPREAATGSGFYVVAPTLTAILPSDPAVLFGSMGYSKNFGRDVNSKIGNVLLTRVDPGDSLNFSGGIGLALNQRTTLNIGYAHTWVFSTYTLQSAFDNQGKRLPPLAVHSRDLQLGRLLFGVTYRATERTSINWSVETGATRDATDVRTVLRIPINLLSGSSH